MRLTAALPVIAAGALTIPAPLAAQIVGGRAVAEQTRRPLGGVRVALLRAPDAARPASDSVLASAVTLGDGVFYITAPDTGRYSLRFWHAGAGPTETHDAPPVALGVGEVVEREYVLPALEALRAAARDRIYFDFQIEQPVEFIKRPRVPTYPKAMRERGIEGDVLVQFVVDTLGRADLRTVRALRETDPAFTWEVRQALKSAHFRPARLGGRVVRQMVQVPFQFRLAASPFPPPDRPPLPPPLPPAPWPR